MSFKSKNAACSCFNSKSWKLYFGREAPTWQNNSNDKIFQGVLSPLQSRQVNIDFWFESYKSCTNTDLKTPAESKWEDILVTISSRIRWHEQKLVKQNHTSQTCLLLGGIHTFVFVRRWLKGCKKNKSFIKHIFKAVSVFFCCPEVSAISIKVWYHVA